MHLDVIGSTWMSEYGVPSSTRQPIDYWQASSFLKLFLQTSCDSARLHLASIERLDAVSSSQASAGCVCALWRPSESEGPVTKQAIGDLMNQLKQAQAQAEAANSQLGRSQQSLDNKTQECKSLADQLRKVRV